MKTRLFNFSLVLIGVFVAGSQATNVTSAIESLSKRLEFLESKLDVWTTQSRQKKELVFRGEPEVGIVSASGVYNPKGDSVRNHGGIDFALDKDLFTFWCGDKSTGGDFMKVEFHKTEMVKKIDLFRRSDSWAQQNAMERYLIEVILFRDKG